MMLDDTTHPDNQNQAVVIHLLGAFCVQVGDREIPVTAWRLRKAAHLVKLLALTPGHLLHREQVCDLLWPDLDPEAAYNNLRYALHVARRTLDGPGAHTTLLPMRQQLIALHPPGALSIDAEAFEAAAAVCRDDPALYHVALALYPGDLLPEDRYEAWAEARRAALRVTYHTLCMIGAQWHEARGEFAVAIPLLQRVVADEPLHEEACVALMRTHAQLGQRTEALAAYARLRAALARELEAAPSAASQGLYTAILAGRFPPTSASAASSPDPQMPPRLPIPLTRFIGRERERMAISELLAHQRLVTLTGAGGCGKTRLALAVAIETAASYADGVWLTECAGLVDPRRVAQTVATTLGVREETGRSVTETLADALRHKHLLLVLDNCEQVLAGCSALAAALLAACPRLRLLVTSREALHVPGEVLWRVPALSLPASKATVAELDASEAAQLFIDRVRWRQPDFTLTEEDGAAVAAICCRLDGLPLALELAAARTNVLSLTQLVARLDDALGLLTDGARIGIPHQQTLRATLDWSYALLDAPERLLLSRLACFAGGCDLGAAEEICSTQGLPRADILVLLAHLVDKSLVQVEITGTEARYRLLEVVRQYVHERLAAQGEVDWLALRHATYYLTLAEDAHDALLGPDQGVWLARLEVEHDNLRAALRCFLAGRQSEPGLRLARDLWRFWYARGYLSEGNIWLTQFLALGRAMPGAAPAALWIDALFAAGRVVYFRGEYAAAGALFTEMRAAAVASGDDIHLASALTQLGNVALYTGEIAEAQALYAEGLTLRQASGDHRAISTSLGNLGWVALLQDEYATARRFFTACLPLHRQLNDRIEIARTLTGLGLVAIAEREEETAHAFFTEGLTMCQALGAKRGIADCLDGLAVLATAQGHYERALRLAGAASALEAAIGNPLPPLWQVRRAQALIPARQALGEAASAEWLLVGRTLPLDHAIAEARAFPYD